MSKAIKIAVSGASGKMGIEIINLINKTKNLILNTALDQKDSPHIGKKIKNTDNKSIEISRNSIRCFPDIEEESTSENRISYTSAQSNRLRENKSIPNINHTLNFSLSTE